MRFVLCEIDLWFTDDTVKRFESYGWHVEQIDQAILKAQKETSKPSLICCKTVIGFGSPNKSGTAGIHGSPLGDDEIEITRKALNWIYEPFEIPEEIYQEWNAIEKGETSQNEWINVVSEYLDKFPEDYKEFMRRIANLTPKDFSERFESLINECLQNEASMATRKASQVCLDHFCEYLPELLGGSADLTGSNNTFSKHNSELTPDNGGGSHIYYGVREFGMVAMMNGMCLHGGIRPYGGTFLVFMDYARNAVRLSAMMQLPNIYVFTHDSIGLGEDGPTHQPIEHLVTLRSTPNLYNWRPADLTETAVAWKNAIVCDSPTCLILSRQSLPKLPLTKDHISQIDNGGYVLRDSDNPKINLIATGSEVQLAIEAYDLLAEKGISSTVISMPCLDIFLEQSEDFQESVIRPDTPCLVIEAAHPNSWYQLLGKDDAVMGMTTFGESAPGNILFEEFGFTTDEVVKKATQLIK